MNGLLSRDNGVRNNIWEVNMKRLLCGDNSVRNNLLEVNIKRTVM